jgi:hypothetical protein
MKRDSLPLQIGRPALNGLLDRTSIKGGCSDGGLDGGDTKRVQLNFRGASNQHIQRNNLWYWGG